MTRATAHGGTAQRARVHRLSPTALALVLLAHAGLFAGLLSMQSFTPPEPANALMVELFQDPVTAPKSPVLSPSRPVAEPARPQQTQNRQQPKVAQPLLASESAQAAPSFEAAKPEKATPAVATSAVATQASTAPAATPATAPAAATTAPRFDAAYLDNPAPVYPPLSRRAGEEGRVLLHVLVEASGVAAQVEVRSSSGFERLDRAAMAAVRRWKFVPAKQGAEAVAAWVLVPIVFGLKG